VNNAVAKGILKEIENTLLVKERADPFKDRSTLIPCRDLILGKGELNRFAHAHRMETDLISLIFIVDKENLIVGKGLIDEHDAYPIK
jgi:hypothetical protein